MMDYQPKKKKKCRRFRFFHVLLLLLSILTLIAVGILFVFFSTGSDDVFIFPLDLHGETVAQIENRLNTPLPESATNIYGFYWSGGYAFKIHFDLRADDVLVFLDNISYLCSDTPMQENVMPIESEREFWSPQKAEKFSGTECSGDDWYWRIMVDRTNTKTWTIYIEGGAE